MRSKLIAVVLLVGVVLWSLAALSPESPSQEVKQEYRELLDKVSIHSETSPLARIFKAKKIAPLLAKNFKGALTGLPEKPVRLTAKSIERYLLSAYRVSREINVDIVDERVTPVDRGYQIDSEIRVYSDRSDALAPGMDIFQIRMVYRKKRGEWRVLEADVSHVSRLDS